MKKTFILVILLLISTNVFAKSKSTIVIYEGIKNPSLQCHVVYKKSSNKTAWIHLMQKSPKRTINSWKCFVDRGITHRGVDAKGNRETFVLKPTSIYRKGKYNPKTGQYQKGIPKPPYRFILRGLDQDFRFVKRIQ